MERFLHWYQHLPQMISPSIIRMGSFEVRWYSLGYIIGILLLWGLVLWRLRKQENTFPLSRKQVETSILYIFLGVVLGGRFGYILFYDLGTYWSDPMSILLPFSFKGGFHFTGIAGMSYHGGVLGCLLMVYLFCRRYGIGYLKFMDFYLPCTSLGFFFGRLGNFTNGELYGRITEVPWGMYFYRVININGQKIKRVFEELRHPSQLYEAFFEGLVLFLILWFLRNKKMKTGTISVLYLCGYGLFRFVIEFYREPDKQFRDPGETIGTVLWFLSMGQILCLCMVLLGLLIYFGIVQKTKEIQEPNN